MTQHTIDFSGYTVDGDEIYSRICELDDFESCVADSKEELQDLEDDLSVETDQDEIEDIKERIESAEDDLMSFQNDYGEEEQAEHAELKEKFGDSCRNETYYSEYAVQDQMMESFDELNIPTWITIDIESTLKDYLVDYTVTEIDGETLYSL